MFVAGRNGNGGSNDDVDVFESIRCQYIADNTVDDDGVGIKWQVRPVLFPSAKREKKKWRASRDIW